ncbi:hypothetical protein H8B19_10735 [Neptunicella marina]|uniref:Uncharacterized protein n=2 Tax=Neptunicella marina TaxID=2125989 RepID=A0A8J6M2Q4_9ALTE|nr:hypothetical protein [Neptunicella marina]
MPMQLTTSSAEKACSMTEQLVARCWLLMVFVVLEVVLHFFGLTHDASDLLGSFNEPPLVDFLLAACFSALIVVAQLTRPALYLLSLLLVDLLRLLRSVCCSSNARIDLPLDISVRSVLQLAHGCRAPPFRQQ